MHHSRCGRAHVTRPSEQVEPPAPPRPRRRHRSLAALAAALCLSAPGPAAAQSTSAAPATDAIPAGERAEERPAMSIENGSAGRPDADPLRDTADGGGDAALPAESRRRAGGPFSFDAFAPTSADVPSAPAMALQYEVRGAWQTNVSEQDAQFAMIEHDLRLAAPLRQDETEQWLVMLRLRGIDIEGAARLPDTGDRLPDALYDPRLGLRYTRRLTNGWLAGVDAQIGSPGDRPYASSDEIAVNATAFARIPHGGKNAWHFFLNFANNRDFANYVPLPGVGYEFHTDTRLNGLIGVPYSRLSYEPVERFSLRASYLIPRNIDAEAAWSLEGAGELFGGYEWDNSRWFRHDRADEDAALTWYEQRVKGGWRYRAGAMSLELEGGYAFQRFWFEAEEYDDRGDNRIDVGDGPYLMFQVRVEF